MSLQRHEDDSDQTNNRGIAQLRSANTSTGTVSTCYHSSTHVTEILPITSIAGRAECRSTLTIIATLHESTVWQGNIAVSASNSESTSHLEHIVHQIQIHSGHSTNKSLASEAAHAECEVTKCSLKEVTEPKTTTSFDRRQAEPTTVNHVYSALREESIVDSITELTSGE